jgi:hypothetical protein
VQGLASVTVPGREIGGAVLLSILAPGSGAPDVLSIQLDDPDSVARAVATLDASPALFRASLGMQAADVVDLQGPVVISVESGGVAQAAGVAVGDTILRANTQDIPDSSALAAVLAASRVDDVLDLELRDRAGAPKRAQVRVARVPQVISTETQTLLFNTLILGFRARLTGPPDPSNEPVLRLNLAVALMRVGNWPDARAELEKVRLPDGPGVANGTVQYLLGVCSEALGSYAEAEAAWRSAAAAKDTLLTAEGPAVKELAERKLADLARRLRRPH